MVANRRANSLQDALAVLNCHRLPARLNTSEVAILLGFHEHDVAPLIAAKLLSPLGKPAPNAPKYFATVEIERCAQNADWLSQATRALAKHWLRKNGEKTTAKSNATVVG